MGEAFTPLDRRRAFEAIVDQIRDAILRDRFRPGDRLPTERELAAQFGVARHAVREAIRVLEHSGLVDVRRGAHGGIYVPASPPDDLKGHLLEALLETRRFSVEDLFRAKLLIEPAIAEAAASAATDEQLAELRRVLEREDRALAEGGDAYEAIAEFHTTVARLSDNPILLQVALALERAARLLHQAGGPGVRVHRVAHGEHVAIHRALSRRRPRAAREAMAEHLKAMETRYLNAVALARSSSRPDGAVRGERRRAGGG